MKKVLFSSLAAAMMAAGAQAQNFDLPAPQKTGGMPLMEAINARHSTREFSTKQIDSQTLSNLLWAAWGTSRGNKRTAPSANNKQEYTVYAVMESGTYRYNAKEHALELVSSKDLRPLTGQQSFAAAAPLNLVYAYDKAITNGKYAYVDCGFIAENVYLFCASANLKTVVRGMFDPEALSAALGLDAQYEVVLCQTVGY